MSEYKSEKVYLHYVDDAPILVDSLGLRIGVQSHLDIIGNVDGPRSAIVKLEIDGKWSQEVANDFVSAGGRPVVKKDVYRDSAYEYLHRFGLQDFKVLNGQDGIEMEISCMSKPDFVMVNGEKFVREQVEKIESKLSVEVDASEIVGLAKEVEDALERDRQYWREMAASGGIQGAQVGELHSFPICPLESAISETVRHLREGQEFNLKAPPEVQRPDEPNQMLAQHLKKLLSAQYERMSK